MTTIYQRVYTDATKYWIKEVRCDGYQRQVSDQHARYLAWLAAGNTPASVSGDRFVTIIDGQPVIDPSRDATLRTEAATAVKVERNARLQACDWTQLADVVTRGTLTAEQQAAWSEYRAALYAVTHAPDFDPFNPAWPTAPEVL